MDMSTCGASFRFFSAHRRLRIRWSLGCVAGCVAGCCFVFVYFDGLERRPRRDAAELPSMAIDSSSCVAAPFHWMEGASDDMLGMKTSG